MKKIMIAGAGVAILGVTSLPFTGVFAVEGGMSVVDQVTVTVPPSCQMTTNGDGETVTLTGQAGAEYGEQSGTTMTMSCNTPNGWTLKAEVTDLAVVGHKDWTIPFGAYDANMNNEKSVWSVGLTMAEGAVNSEVNSDWENFSATEKNVVVVQGTGVSMATVTPKYKAYVSEDALSGAYQGEISYTFLENE